VKIARHGNKAVVCNIWKDEDMPYLTTEAYSDEDGVVHPSGPHERVDLITNSLAVINRTIPMALIEPSITFILDRTRKHMATLNNDDAVEFMFKIMDILNPYQSKDLRALYKTLSDREKRKFVESSISLDSNGLIMTNQGIYIRWEAFSKEINLRDAIIEIYEKYGDVIKPYNIFVPKPNWGRDIYIGKDYVGYQYILLLKQSGERGFSVRSAGAISDESLPEKSHESKISKAPFSETPIRFGEYEILYSLNYVNCGNISLGNYYSSH